MKLTLIVAVIISALVSSGITYAVIKPKTEAITPASNSSMNHNMAGMSMSAMNDELKDKSGDAFDKAFIEMMIAHHQGAIDMANAAKANAKHSEIKAMADDIITAQTRESEQMKDWRKEWGY